MVWKSDKSYNNNNRQLVSVIIIKFNYGIYTIIMVIIIVIIV